MIDDLTLTCQKMRTVLPFSVLCVALLLAIATSDAPSASKAAPTNAVPVVLLPLAAGGIRDERQLFVPFFQQELNNLRIAPAQRSAGAYLHLDAAAPKDVSQASPASERVRMARLDGVSILVLPGIFGDCVDEQSLPFGDGVRRRIPFSYTASYQEYADLGAAGMRALRIRGRAGSAQNGAFIAREIILEAARPEVTSIILVAYSKGVPDALHALSNLELTRQLPGKLTSMVSIAGVVMGTPLADAHAGLYKALADLPSLFGCSPSDGEEIDSLRPQVRIAWLASHPPPRALTYYSIVAYAARDQVSPGLVRFFDELSATGSRNDGEVVPAHAILPHSRLLAEVNSDHWTFVLPLASHPNRLIRTAASHRPFPRQALFRAILRYIVTAADESSARGELGPDGAVQLDPRASLGGAVIAKQGYVPGARADGGELIGRLQGGEYVQANCTFGWGGPDPTRVGQTWEVLFQGDALAPMFRAPTSR